MSEREWKPKVGDKVMVVGCSTEPFVARISTRESDWRDSDWFTLWPNAFVHRVHIRNLDPVLEDERKGAPRPPIRVGEEVEIALRVTALQGCGEIEVRLHGGIITTRDPRVRQIERRVSNLGREARK